MTDRRIEDLNIASQQVLTSPEDLKTQLPTTSMIADGVMQARQTIKNILDGKDHRLFVVIGPALFMIRRLLSTMGAAWLCWPMN